MKLYFYFQSSEKELGDIFQEYGEIARVDICRKTRPDKTINVFGFVQFKDPKDMEKFLSLKVFYDMTILPNAHTVLSRIIFGNTCTCIIFLF